MLTRKTCTTGKGIQAPKEGKSARVFYPAVVVNLKIRLRLLILTTVENFSAFMRVSARFSRIIAYNKYSKQLNAYNTLRPISKKLQNH
jgi:hypothetical protein